MGEDNKSIEEIIAISYFDTDNIDIKKHTERYFEIRRNIVDVLNKYNIMWTVTDTNGFNNKDKEIEKLKEREKKLQESFSDWKKGIEKERKYWLCERTDCCGRIKDGKKYSSLYQENKRLNNIINELERKMLNDKLYVENISKKQPYPIEEFRIRNPYTTGSYDTCINYLDKLQKLKGSDKE